MFLYRPLYSSCDTLHVLSGEKACNAVALCGVDEVTGVALPAVTRAVCAYLCKNGCETCARVRAVFFFCNTFFITPGNLFLSRFIRGTAGTWVICATLNDEACVFSNPRRFSGTPVASPSECASSCVY